MGPRYCGQANVLMAYGRAQPWTYRQWNSMKQAIIEHRTTCITCRPH